MNAIAERRNGISCPKTVKYQTSQSQSIQKNLTNPLLPVPSPNTQSLGSPTHAAFSLDHLGRVSALETTLPLDQRLWMPLSDPLHKLRIAVVPNERPALFDVAIFTVLVAWIRYCGGGRARCRGGSAVFNQCLRIFQIPVNGLDSSFYSILLYLN